QLHRVVRRAVEVVGTEAHRATEAGQPHRRMAREVAQHGLVPAGLEDVDVVVEAGDHVDLWAGRRQDVVDRGAEGGDGAAVAAGDAGAVLQDEELGPRRAGGGGKPRPDR